MSSSAPNLTAAQAPTFGDLFRVRGVKPLLGALAFSAWGDYIARICVATAILERTRSPLLAALAFAVSLLPTLLGRTVFGPVADRFSYRSVLVVADSVRGSLAVVLALAVALHGATLLLLALVFLLELAGGPAITAQANLFVDFLPDGRYYNRVTAVNETLDQSNQAIGLLVGGVLAAAIGPVWGLVIDALTFVLTATTVLNVIPRREARPPAPATTPDPQTPHGYWYDLRSGARYLVRHRLLMAILLLMLVTSVGVTAPEAAGLAYARIELNALQLGGLLMAVPIVGLALGVVLMSRRAEVSQLDAVPRLALVMPLPLVLVWLWPSVYVVVPLFFLCGLLTGYILPLQSTFMLLLDPDFRGRAYGIASSLAVGIGGVAYLVCGALIGVLGPPRAVAAMGLGCLVLTALVLVRWPGRELHEAAETIYRARTE